MPEKVQMNIEKDSRSEQLSQELTEERSGRKSIYQIARIVQMLKYRGVPAVLTESEQNELIKGLENARGDDRRILPALPQGYEIARWLMMLKIHNPTRCEITQEDQELIRTAAKKFQISGNRDYFSSLVVTAHSIGIEISAEWLTEQERIEISNEIKLINQYGSNI